jgi:uncharacterized membrane-anchored protein YitT (DUF2179 family)
MIMQFGVSALRFLGRKFQSIIAMPLIFVLLNINLLTLRTKSLKERLMRIMKNMVLKWGLKPLQPIPIAR